MGNLGMGGGFGSQRASPGGFNATLGSTFGGGQAPA